MEEKGVWKDIPEVGEWELIGNNKVLNWNLL